MSETTTYRNALPLDSMLLEYRLESVLGAGGFGMTYLGWDTHLEKHVAIKEYLPTELAVRALDGSVVPVTTEHEYNYQWGLERFILEARTLARFSHPNIVRVNRYFEANSTGYMVMDYEKGESLNQMLKRAPQPDEVKLKAILMPLLDGLQAVHEAGFLHRDIKPSNIFLRDNGNPVLLDFGAARHAIGGATKSLTSVLTPGYAPLEQYSSDGHQGPWSDIYALAGVLYRAIVDYSPPDAVSRMRDDAVPQALAAARSRYSAPFIAAVEWGLALDEKQRPQSVLEWRPALLGEAQVPEPAPADTRLNAGTTVPHDAEAVRLAQARTAQGAEKTQPMPLVQPRAARPEPDRARRSRWRWVGIGLAVFIVVAVAAAWNKQRSAGKLAQTSAVKAPPAPEPGPPKPVATESAPEKPKLRTKPAPVVAEQSPAKVVEGVPARPPRERTDRPGDEQRPELEEMRRKTEREFRSADRDGDGYLSRDEVRGHFPFIEREFQRVDTDGDGRISPQEFFRFRRWQAQQRQQK